MTFVRSLIVALLVCFGTGSIVGLAGHQSSLACDPPPDQPKQPPKK